LFKITVILATTAPLVLLLRRNALRELTPLLKEPSRSLTVKSALLVLSVTPRLSQLYLLLVVALAFTVPREPKSALSLNALRVTSVLPQLSTRFIVKPVLTKIWMVKPHAKIAL
jgi:hypothetical protein